MMTMALRGLFLLMSLSIVATTAFARGGTKTIAHDFRQFLEGELDGLAIDPHGQLVPAPVHPTPMVTNSLYAWSMALDHRGRLIVGGGDDGQIYRSDGDTLEPWVDTLAFEILSLLPIGDDVLAGSSPDGVIYRVDESGELTIELDVPQQSIWSLAAGSRPGTWLAGAGPGARLIRGGEGFAAGEVVHRIAATNLTVLLRDEGGLWIGTQGPGLVLRIEGDDDESLGLRYEAPHDEITEILSDGDGGVYVLSVDAAGDDDTELGSRIAWLPREGAVEIVWEGDEILLSMDRAADGAFVVGEAKTGRILRLDAQGRMGLWAELDGGDPLDLLIDGQITWVATGNLGIVYALEPARTKGGSYESPVIPTPRAERWGRLWVDGWGSEAKFSVRSGLREKPDESWSSWSDDLDAGAVIDAPLGAYLQYRLRLEDGAVSAVHVAWAERNLPPKVTRLKVLEVGSDLAFGGAGSNGSPVVQRFDNGLQVEYTTSASPKRAEPEGVAWVRGIRTILWEASDPNDDELRYRVQAHRLPDGDWYEIVRDHRERLIAWDTTTLRDGAYRVRVTATDAEVHPRGKGRESSFESDTVRVDNSAPEVVKIERESENLRIHVRDATSPIREADVRIDSEGWTPLEPADGVVDSPVEEFVLPIERLESPNIWIRVVDGAGNTTIHAHRIEE